MAAYILKIISDARVTWIAAIPPLLVVIIIVTTLGFAICLVPREVTEETKALDDASHVRICV